MAVKAHHIERYASKRVVFCCEHVQVCPNTTPPMIKERALIGHHERLIKVLVLHLKKHAGEDMTPKYAWHAKKFDQPFHKIVEVTIHVDNLAPQNRSGTVPARMQRDSDQGGSGFWFARGVDGFWHSLHSVHVPECYDRAPRENVGMLTYRCEAGGNEISFQVLTEQKMEDIVEDEAVGKMSIVLESFGISESSSESGDDTEGSEWGVKKPAKKAAKKVGGVRQRTGKGRRPNQQARSK